MGEDVLTVSGVEVKPMPQSLKVISGMEVEAIPVHMQASPIPGVREGLSIELYSDKVIVNGEETNDDIFIVIAVMKFAEIMVAHTPLSFKHVSADRSESLLIEVYPNNVVIDGVDTYDDRAVVSAFMKFAEKISAE